MTFEGMNYLAILLAAISGMVAGAAWYGALAKPWMKAVGMTGEPKGEPKIYIIALIAQFVIAYVLAGLIGHMGPLTVSSGIVSALFAWAGFTLAPMAVNHRFQNNGWDLTLIDGGYWLVVFVLQGAIIGWMGV
jgi:hypothetical protein